MFRTNIMYVCMYVCMGHVITEELDVPLVLFNEVLNHVLRIDRIFKQQQVGVSCGSHALIDDTPLGSPVDWRQLGW